jgi:hypothetical protein
MDTSHADQLDAITAVKLGIEYTCSSTTYSTCTHMQYIADKDFHDFHLLSCLT